MSGTSRPLFVWRRGHRLTAIVLALPIALVSGACNSSSEARVDRTLLTRAAASLALSVGELVERYAAELPTGDDEQMDIERLKSILADSADALDFGAAGSSFATAASASRKVGNGKVETARQLQAAARLASEAFRPPLPDYKPGDQALLAAIASRLEPELNAALTSTYNLETGDVKITHLDSILADAVQFVILVAGYNYADQNGSHTIRDRMQRLGMRAPRLSSSTREEISAYPMDPNRTTRLHALKTGAYPLMTRCTTASLTQRTLRSRAEPMRRSKRCSWKLPTRPSGDLAELSVPMISGGEFLDSGGASACLTSESGRAGRTVRELTRRPQRYSKAKLVLCCRRTVERSGTCSSRRLTRASVDPPEPMTTVWCREQPGRTPSLDETPVCLAPEHVSGAHNCLDMSVEYAKVRIQFGRAVGWAA